MKQAANGPRRSVAAGLVAIFLALGPQLAGSQDLQDGVDAYVLGDFVAAYTILAPAATIEYPMVQNLVALMHYRGQGVAADAVQAHTLLHSAAAAGSSDAHRNLGILHSIGAPGVAVDYEEARLWFEIAATDDALDESAAGPGAPLIPSSVATVIEVQRDDDGRGRDTYLMFCAGCHGFSGMRFYPFAPSFAMNDRMTKSDAELMRSILDGKGLMPSWEDKLPIVDLEGALRYLRELALRTGYGTDTSAYDETPDVYFRFQPPGYFDPYATDLMADPLDEN